MVQQNYQSQIDYLKEQYFEDYSDDDDKKSIMDLLSEYGNEGIDTIREIIRDPSIKNQKIKNYGLDLIRYRA
jgi:hypothetical protein